jgi:hypothetical protein
MPYRNVNVAGLCLALFGLALPAIRPLLIGALPERWMECASPRWFGRPCPLCGLTRGVGALLSGDTRAASEWNPLAIPVLAWLAAEIVYRVAMLAVERRRPIPRVVMRADLALHAVLAAAYLAYAAGFVLGTM